MIEEVVIACWAFASLLQAVGGLLRRVDCLASWQPHTRPEDERGGWRRLEVDSAKTSAIASLAHAQRTMEAVPGVTAAAAQQAQLADPCNHAHHVRISVSSSIKYRDFPGKNCHSFSTC